MKNYDIPIFCMFYSYELWFVGMYSYLIHNDICEYGLWFMHEEQLHQSDVRPSWSSSYVLQDVLFFKKAWANQLFISLLPNPVGINVKTYF